MKRVLSLFVAVCLLSGLFTAMPVFAETRSGKCGNQIFWLLDADGTLTIQGHGKIWDRRGDEWTEEPDWDDRILSDTKSIVIENGVTGIGDYAFQGAAAETVVFPESLRSIGEGAFWSCTKLSRIELPENLTELKDGAFCGCTLLSEVAFLGKLTAIPEYAFRECENLRRLTLNAGIQSIGKEAFRESGLEHISLPSGITHIGMNAFAYTPYEKATGNWSGSILCIGSYLIEVNQDAEAVELEIPANVECIADGALWADIAGITVNPANTHYKMTGSGLYTKDGKKLVRYIPGDDETACRVPEGVTAIGCYAFAGWIKLADIQLPETVREIGHGAFIYCAVETMRLPDGIPEIPERAFYNCTSLRSIAIPKSVTKMGPEAFSKCSIQTIYYAGGEEEWGQIENVYGDGWDDDGSGLSGEETIRFNSTGPVTPVYSMPENINGTFNFASGKGSAEFTYQDNYFRLKATTYRHDLAQMSIRLALSAFAKLEGKNKYRNQAVNVEDLLGKLNFRDFETNAWYTKAPEANSIGVAAARKWVTYPDGDYTVIAVAIRGGGYENEWGGNFNVGTDTEHAGFKLARDQVLEFLKSYVRNYNITGNVKLWITGYSRAAATTNLTAAYLDTHPLVLNDANAAPDQIITLNPENIYAYCFETPAGVRNPDNASGKYNNIFSIVNQHDFVPMVAMRKWGYDRYGITKYLPTPQTNSNYHSLADRMITLYNKYNAKTYVVDNFACYYPTSSWITDVDKGLFNGQGVFLERTIDQLADAVENPERYVEEFQDVFEYIGDEVMGSGNTTDLVNSLIDEFQDNGILIGVESGVAGSSVLSFRTGYLSGRILYATVRQSIIAAFNDIGLSISKNAVDSIADLLLDIGIDGVVTIAKNLDGIAQGHYPELCMAWLDAINENDFRDKRLRTLYLNCPVDMEIYDSTDRLVGAIYHDQVQDIADSSLTVFVDENGQKLVYLPADEAYSIKVTATDDGEVTYSVQETTGDQVKVINYQNISVKKDDVLTGTAENLTEVETAAYPLSVNDVQATPEVIEEAVPIEISAAAEGNGNVSQGGTYYQGEFAKLTAIPAENEEFLGWYEGETPVSQDVEYRFAVTDNADFTAKFTENTCEIVFVDENDAVLATQRIVKGSGVTIPELLGENGRSYDGVYTDKTYTSAVQDGDTFAEDTVLYAKPQDPFYTDGFGYYVNEDGTAEIVEGYASYSTWIPVSIAGHLVTKIADGAFAGEYIRELLLPDTVTAIGQGAFENCYTLDTVYYIGSETQWGEIAIGENNEALQTAARICSYRKNIVSGWIKEGRELEYTDGSAKGTLIFDYVYLDCTAVFTVSDYDGVVETTVNIEIPKGTTEQEFSIPFAADDEGYDVQIAFVSNTPEQEELGEKLYNYYFYALRPRYRDGDWWYAIVDGNAEVVGYDGDATDIIIPDTLSGMSVTRIGKETFAGRRPGLTSVEIPNSVTYIGDFAFHRNSLTQVRIPEAVTYIGEGAFVRNDLTQITLPPNLKEIGDSAFAGNPISAVDIPASVTTIGEAAFAFCSDLASITVADGNPAYMAVDGNLYSKDQTELLQYAVGKTASVWTIPGTVKRICEGALASSPYLKDVTIPNSVTEIGAEAFFYCENLQDIIVDGGNQVYYAENGVLFNKEKTVLLQYPIGRTDSFYKVPEGVEIIETYAFAESTLERIIFPMSLDWIKDYAFEECNNLTKVYYAGPWNGYPWLEIGEGNDVLYSADTSYSYRGDGRPACMESVTGSYHDGTLTATVSFCDLQQAGVLYLAVYNKANVLIAFDCVPVTPEGEMVITQDLTLPENCVGDTIKAFFWEDALSAQPLALPIESKVINGAAMKV